MQNLKKDFSKNALIKIMSNILLNIIKKIEQKEKLVEARKWEIEFGQLLKFVLLSLKSI